MCAHISCLWDLLVAADIYDTSALHPQPGDSRTNVCHSVHEADHILCRLFHLAICSEFL